MHMGGVRALGGEVVEFDYAPLLEAARLLYGGPWVAERLAAVKEFAAAHPEGFDPTVGAIIQGGSKFSAVDAFEGSYKLQEIRRAAEKIFEGADFLLLPTAATSYKIREV